MLCTTNLDHFDGTYRVSCNAKPHSICFLPQYQLASKSIMRLILLTVHGKCMVENFSPCSFCLRWQWLPDINRFQHLHNKALLITTQKAGYQSSTSTLHAAQSSILQGLKRVMKSKYIILHYLLECGQIIETACMWYLCQGNFCEFPLQLFSILVWFFPWFNREIHTGSLDVCTGSHQDFPEIVYSNKINIMHFSELQF